MTSLPSSAITIVATRYIEPILDGPPGVALLFRWAVRSAANDLSLFGATAGAAFLSAHRLGQDIIPSGLPRVVFSHPATLVCGVAFTIVSLATYRHLHRGDEYQGRFLALMVATGAILGCLGEMEPIAIALRVIPWCVVVALLGSRCVSGAKQSGYSSPGQ